MAADVLDPANAQINELLLAIRGQLREAWDSESYGEWHGSVTFQPRKFSELDSGSRFKKRLTSSLNKN